MSDIELEYHAAGGTFAARYSIYAHTDSELDASLQAISNLTAEPFHRWREAYFDVPVGAVARIKAGKVDANTEFAVLPSAADFSNASFGVSRTLYAMPSYPGGAPGVNAFVSPWRRVEAGIGMYRPLDGGLYAIAELRVRWSGSRAGVIAAGVWKNRGETSGGYLLWDQKIIFRLRAFARLSTADPTVAPASTDTAYGLTWTGIGVRPGDAFGVAVLHAVPALTGRAMATEQAYEFYYKIPVDKLVTLKADIQHVRRPGGLPESPAANVAAVRLIVNYVAGREQ